MSKVQELKDQGIPATGFNHVDLWKFFANQALEIKKAMFTVITWIFTLAGAVSTFIVTNCLKFDSGPIVISQPLVLLLLSSGGVLLMWYAGIALQDYGVYMQKHFDRSDRAQTGRMTFDEIIGDRSDKGKIPGLCKHIRWVIWTFGSAFIIGIVIGFLVTAGLLPDTISLPVTPTP